MTKKKLGRGENIKDEKATIRSESRVLTLERSTTGWIQAEISQLKVQSSPYRNIRYSRMEIKQVLKSSLPLRFYVQPRGPIISCAQL